MVAHRMASPRAATLALDSTEDAAYLARLRCVVCSGAVAQSSGLDPVAPFIDFKTLLRLHNLIEDHTTPEERGSKKAALAYFVMDVTLPLPRKLPLDVGLAEAAGNAMDREVARYDTARKKAEKALRVSEGRAASCERWALALQPADGQRHFSLQMRHLPRRPTPHPPSRRPTQSRRCHPSSRIALARSARVCRLKCKRSRLGSTGCSAPSTGRRNAMPMRRWIRAVPRVV